MRQAFALDQFGGGLNLRDQPVLVTPAHALSCLDVHPTERGGIAQRPGFEPFGPPAAGESLCGLGIHEELDGTRRVLAGYGTNLRAFDEGGSVVHTGTLPNLHGEAPSFARLSAPGTEHTYVAVRDQPPRRYDGVSFTTPTCTVNGVAGQSMGKGGLVAVQTPDVRLVMAGFTAGPNGPGGMVVDESTVVFSNPKGEATSYELSGVAPYGANFVKLSPGDGERIVGLLTWRDRTFVFKQTKYFVFWGNSEDSSGKPVFNWREENLGIGQLCVGAVAGGRDGIYFAHRDGVYRTVGEGAEPVSGQVEPMFHGDLPVAFVADGERGISPAAHDNIRLGWHAERVFMLYSSGSNTVNDRVLVHSPEGGWWVPWSLKADAAISFTIQGRPGIVFGQGEQLYVMDGTDELDAGQPIRSWWQGGWMGTGDEGMTTWREGVAVGQGELLVRVLDDYRDGGVRHNVSFYSRTTDLWGDGTDPDELWGDGSDPTDLWGSGASVLEVGFRPVDSLRGRVFSVRFEALPEGRRWFVQRFTHHTFGRHARLVAS